MRRIGFWFYIVFLLAAVFFGFWFNSENPTPVSVVLMGIALPESSVGVSLLLSMLAGVLLTLIFNFLPALNNRRKLSSLERQKRQLTAQISELKEQHKEPE